MCSFRLTRLGSQQSTIQNGVRPPVTPITSPVMYEASGDARNTNAGASSRGCAGQPKSVSAPNFRAFSAGIVEGISGVQTGPGATAFTRIPCLDTNFARAFVKPIMAAFV